MKNTILSLSIILLIFSRLNAQIPTNGLLLYYPFSGQSIDQSGNSLNTTFGDYWNPSSGSSLTNDRFNKPDSAANISITGGFGCNQLDLNQSFSFSLWATVDAQTSFTDEVFISQGTNQANQGFKFGFYTGSDNIVAFHYLNWGSDNISYSFQNDSQWHHYALTYNATSKILTLYFDGSAQAILNSTMPHSGGVYGEMWFGTSDESPASNFYGKLDEVRIYNRELSYSEIATIYNENKQEQTISMPTITTLTIESADITLPTTSDDGLPLTYTSSDPTVISVSGNILHIVGEGTALITATQKGNTFYISATVSQYVTVGSTSTTAITSASAIESKIFPNPTQDKININGFDNYEYLILNQQGSIIKSGVIKESVIDVSYLNTGLYFLQINSSVIKIIKE